MIFTSSIRHFDPDELNIKRFDSQVLPAMWWSPAVWLLASIHLFGVCCGIASVSYYLLSIYTVFILRFASVTSELRLQTVLLLDPGVCASGSDRRPPRRCPAHQLSRRFSTLLCNANGCHLLKQTSCASSVNVGAQSSSGTAGLSPLQNATYLCPTHTHTQRYFYNYEDIPLV